MSTAVRPSKGVFREAVAIAKGIAICVACLAGSTVLYLLLGALGGGYDGPTP